MGTQSTWGSSCELLVCCSQYCQEKPVHINMTHVCCSSSGLLSLLRWSSFGAGATYGVFRWNSIRALRLQQAEEREQKWEAERAEFKDTIAKLQKSIEAKENPSQEKSGSNAAADLFLSFLQKKKN